MNSNSVVIVDYGVGNLFSVQRALEVCGAGNIRISRNPTEILAAGRIILPGVGAFSEGIRGLKESGLDRALCDFADLGRPLLGICLGMQLFATISEEFGLNSGLNLIPGRVVSIPSRNFNEESLKLPYIGWSSLGFPENAVRENSALATLSHEKSVYFVHSYHFVPENREHIIATYSYGGHDITAVIQKDNVTGLQFHPEKSGKAGLSILRGFIGL
jgi:glutamine amidotransferase